MKQDNREKNIDDQKAQVEIQEMIEQRELTNQALKKIIKNLETKQQQSKNIKNI